MFGPIARRALEGIAVRVSERVAIRVETRTTGRVQELGALVASLQQQVTQLVPSIHALGILDSNIELFASADDAMHEIRVHGVQLELLKAQLMAFERTLDDLGRAIAPDAGIDARRTPVRRAARPDPAPRPRRTRAPRRRPRARPASGSRAESASPVTRNPNENAGGTADVDFDYVGFERRFRGDPADGRDDARRALRRAARRSCAGARCRLRSRRSARRAARGRHRGPRRRPRRRHGRRGAGRGLDVVQRRRSRVPRPQSTTRAWARSRPST